MTLRFNLARGLAAASTVGLKYVFRRPAANFPGKLALYIDPQLLRHLRARVGASVCVVGTNGKTTVTNLLADALEVAGQRVICNRTGANLDSGVATALLQARAADWGVFECDELWLAKVLPALQSRYVVLLNLFRDQLDRVGEIDHIQQSIASALARSPHTTLIYNADDPLCQAIADAISNERVPFGLAQDMELEQNATPDAQMCQHCSTMLDYTWRQYGQLGNYRCPHCGFERAAPLYSASDITRGTREDEGSVGEGAGVCEGSVRKSAAGGGISREATTFCVKTPRDAFVLTTTMPGAYMIYNLLAVATAASLAGVAAADIQHAIDAFQPDNGRLQRSVIAGHEVLLNLAKNPTGFNQNLKIIKEEVTFEVARSDEGSQTIRPDAGGDGALPRAVAFFINDKEGDGRDVSWLWDIDFQELASVCPPDYANLHMFAGGLRKHDMQVCLKYAGFQAELVNDARDFVARAAALGADTKMYAIANYTALPAVKAQLDALATGMRDEAAGAPAIAVASELATEPATAVVGESATEAATATVGESATESATKTAVAAAVPAATEAPAESTRQPTTPEAPYPRLVIAHLFPTLLNLYGDSGNVRVLAERARMRGIDVEVRAIGLGDELDFSDVDLVFLGGGPDREQQLASRALLEGASHLRAYVEDDGVLLAICGGFQIIGREWFAGDEKVEGLGLVGGTTRRAPGGSHNRLVGDIALESPLATRPVVGYENHAGRTFLDEGVQPFGRVIGAHGVGNNEADHADGVRYRNVVGTYLHGPLLAKNPEVADFLLQQALNRRAARIHVTAPTLTSLDDSVELTANAILCERLGVR